MAQMMLGLLACAACAAASFTDGEKLVILSAANEASFETLHYQYDLFDYNARAIIAGRRYRTLEELSAVVDTSVQELILNGAQAKCLKTKIKAGTYNGLYFTEAEAERTLALANKGEYKGLVEVGDIFASKVTELLKQRPVCSMKTLSKIKGFSYYPLYLMKRLSADERICYSADDCTDVPQVCEGKSRTLGFGRCRTPDVPFVPCATDSECANGGGGVCIFDYCQPTYLAGRFTAPAGQEWLEIPPAGESRSVYLETYGLATTPVSVELSIDGSRVTGDLSKLRIDLEDPISEIFPYYTGEGPIPTQAPVGTTGDGSAVGRWFVKVKNGGNAAGKLRVNWLRVKSRYD